MANLRIITKQGQYWDDNAVSTLVHYCLDAKKTMHYVYIGSYAVSYIPEEAILQMQLLQKYLGQTDGVHLRHMVLSFSKDEVDSPSLARTLGNEICKYYGAEYQILFGVHCNTEHLHIHFVMNTVSYRTGKKYPGDRKDYYAFLRYVQEVLEPVTTHVQYVEDRESDES